MKQNNKSYILFRYGFISFFVLLISIIIIGRLFYTTVIEAAEWNDAAKKELSIVTPIPPERGNILSDNGSILACNLTCYDVRLDLRHNIFTQAKHKKIPMASVDSLADSLDVKYPKIPNLLSQHPDTIKKYSWHTRLKQEFEKPFKERTRALTIAKNLSLEEFNHIRNLPYLKNFQGSGRRIPVYFEEKTVRMYPFGKMAFRSIGRVNQTDASKERHGYSGLEKDLDSLLYGKPGRYKRVVMTRGFGDMVEIPPKRGYDILTTIDIDLQDILEEELQAVCDSAKAEWGTAVIMEVKTGEIKAISNLQRFDDGSYGEALNRAIERYEPGSVIKPISMMIAFEDGLVKNVTDAIDCSPFQRTSDPHAPTIKNMKQVIGLSSNTGMARIMFRGYAEHPEKFHDRLASIGFFTPMHTGIADEQIPYVRRLTDKDSKGNNITMTARHLDLARQTYGYNTMIPPIYTLAYYNAMANDGVFVRPHLVRALRDENGRDSILNQKLPGFPDRVCSKETAAKMKQCIREVVWGEHGTARGLQDDRVEIAGKTGTAFPVEKFGYDKSRRRYAFCGFFPYDEPRYTCIALILAPGGNSAAATSGQVLKRVALKLYSRGMLGNKSTYTAQHSNNSPTLAASSRLNDNNLSDRLSLKGLKKIQTPQDFPPGQMPDVKGLEARSALNILERRGYNVKFSGQGRVVAQSVAPGRNLPRGASVLITLRQ
ncbi:MAG: transpeptidase family protein [Prevotella sp.]|nr:transpeptidase family protein [Bacteroides sp.]MCM1366251.1 transpeptidase family protein [Prevotella sp.]MCM1436344.1 transpeptidase family protein [Prevotella sp.]